MCGIVGYIGPRAAIPVIVKGLERLEYRGYDSAGVAIISNNAFEVYRSEGKLSKLKSVLHRNNQLLDDADSEEFGNGCSIGIGHTRWATHGKPSETNAHPHVAGNVCIVHNGIIENYLALRKQLQAQGCTFASETDTEIAAHLINSHLAKANSLTEAVRNAVKEMRGSYALVAMCLNQPDCLVVAKNATPVILGGTDKERFVASDIPAVLEYTREFIALEDGEIAELRQDGVFIEKDGVSVQRKPITITWDPITAEKGGYRHFMLKEINEQPQAVTDALRGRINMNDAQVTLDDVSISRESVCNLQRIYLVACGTAWHAALITKFYIERFARIHCEVDYGSEFRYRDPLIDKDCLFIAISQSGETADTLGSLQLAAEKGAKTLAICNVVSSSIARRADNVLYTHAGPEISVASTKAFVTQLVAGYLLAIHLAEIRGTLNSEQIRQYLEDIVRLPTLLTEALSFDEKIEAISKDFSKSQDMLYLGRGFLYPVALEGALKLKEISYMHAEGYPAGEMKHGPIALINEQTPVVVVLGKDDVNYDKAMSNLVEVTARGGKIIAVTDEANPDLEEVATETISVGPVPTSMLPIVLTVPLQLLAYHVAVHRGTDVDQPRNLAKSVTVE